MAAGACAVLGQDQQPAAGLEVAAQGGERAAVGGERVDLVERPAEPAHASWKAETCGTIATSAGLRCAGAVGRRRTRGDRRSRGRRPAAGAVPASRRQRVGRAGLRQGRRWPAVVAAASPGGGRRRPGPRRRRARGGPARRDRRARPRRSPTTVSQAHGVGRTQQRVDRGGRHGAAAAPAAQRDRRGCRARAAISASLLSAAPTKPTGKARIAAGRSGQSRRRSSRWNSAVGALPIATTAPARLGRQSSTAAAERVVPRSAARPRVRGIVEGAARPATAGRQAVGHDPGRDHARVDEDRSRRPRERAAAGGDRVAVQARSSRDVRHAAGVDQAQRPGRGATAGKRSSATSARISAKERA